MNIYKKHHKDRSQKGFTIVELMFATVIFSLILLLCLSSLVQIGRMYYKGVTTAQTQETARGLMDEVVQAIQFSSGGITSPTGPNGPVVNPTDNPVGNFCIGSTRYTYALDRMQNPSASTDANKKEIKHALYADLPGACAGADLTSFNAIDLTLDNPIVPKTGVTNGGGRDMLAPNMRLTRLEINPLSSDNSTWQVLLTVAYGDDDLLRVDPSDASRRQCSGTSIGTQFCATSELSAIVKRRI